VKDQTSKDNKQIYKMVQPDIYMVCELSKLDDRGCSEAPDLIVEIVSANNSKRDVNDKFEITRNMALGNTGS
jgi:Uma2 family endonuclease